MRVNSSKILLFIGLLFGSLVAQAEGRSIPFDAQAGEFRSKVGFSPSSNTEGKAIKVRFQVIQRADEGGLDRVLVVSPGRTESYLKYKPLVPELLKLGYKKIFIIDHRGQGLSDRLLANPYKGYVEKFEHYVLDFQSFIEQVVLPAIKNEKIDILAHSMGGAIAGVYLLDSKNQLLIDKAIFVSPMWKLNTPTWILKWMFASSCEPDNKVEACQEYAVEENQDPEKRPFRENQNTQSEKWYAFSEQLERDHPEIRLGGATKAWVLEAVRATEMMQDYGSRIQIPTIVFIPEMDQHMDIDALEKTCLSMNRVIDVPTRRIRKKMSKICRPILFPGAFHEILFEKELYRKRAFQLVSDFINEK